MILTPDELRQHVETAEDDKALEDWLQGIEQTIKGRTHNNFVSILKANNGEYPMDIKMGVVNLFKWEQKGRAKVSMGIQSETISRHSVTYTPIDGDNAEMGYPKQLLGFLQPYMKARFGRGLEL